MSSHRQQAHLDAPLETTWTLVATPSLYPDWWPRVIEVGGQRFEEGDEYVQVTRNPTGEIKTSFLIEHREELREIRMSCQLTGMYAHWRLTSAQDGTFVEIEMGMQPQRLRYRLFDAAMGRSYFRKWSDESLAALSAAARDGVGG